MIPTPLREFPDVRKHLVVCWCLCCSLMAVGLGYLPSMWTDPALIIQGVSTNLGFVVFLDLYPLYVLTTQPTPEDYWYYTPKNLTDLIKGLLFFLGLFGIPTLSFGWKSEILAFISLGLGSILLYRTSIYYMIEKYLLQRTDPDHIATTIE